MQQSIEQTRPEGITCAGCIDSSRCRWLEGKTIALCIQSMNGSGTIGRDDNSFGDGLQLASVLAHIYTGEVLTDKRCGVGSNAGKRKRQMIRPDDIADGSGYTRLKSQP